MSKMTNIKERPRDFRRKIKRAEESRDLWKDKHQIVQYELKKARAKLDAVKQSRDKWHDMYEQTSSVTEELNRGLEILQEKNIALQEEAESLRALEGLKKK